MKKAFLITSVLILTQQTICMKKYSKKIDAIEKEFKTIPNTSNMSASAIKIGTSFVSKPLAEKITEKIMGKEDFQKAKEFDKEHPVKGAIIDAVAYIGISCIAKALFG